MRSVRVLAQTKADPEVFWNIITNVKDWKKIIKFVEFIKVSGGVKEGTKFFDITSILLIPALINHKITKIEKHRKFYMEAYMPLATGIMYQTIDIDRKNELTNIAIEIKFKINFFLFDFIFGPILEVRLKTMIIETLEKLKENYKQYSDSRIIQ